MTPTKALLLSILLLAISCSDDTVQPKEEVLFTDYMPIDSIKQWDYQYFGIENNGTELHSPYGFETDTTADSSIYLGRKAVLIGSNTIILGQKIFDDFYYSIDSNEIAISDIKLQVHDSLTLTRKEWTTLYDNYKGSWMNKTISFNDSVIGNSSYNGYISFDGSQRGDTRVEFEGKQIKAFSSIITINYNLVRMQDTLSQIKIKEDYLYTFAKDIGIIHVKYLKYNDTILMGGYQKILTKYKLK